MTWVWKMRKTFEVFTFYAAV